MLAGAVVVTTAAALLALAGPASAGTIVVAPGESIHDAVQTAAPGDTIQLQAGVYEDVVVVKTNDVTIQGVGSGTDGTVLRPPADLPGRCFGGIAGICVMGNRQDGIPVSGVTVTGVRAEGFAAFGFVALLAENTTFEADAGVDAGEYGLAAFESTGTVMRDNVASGNAEAGLYIGDSQNAGATLEGNESFDNGFGFFLRDSRNGVVSGNVAHDNCVGVLILETPGPVRAGAWTISGNTIEDNTAFCRGGGPGEPSTSGIGVAIAGGRGNTIEGNVIQGNTTRRDLPFHGGVVLIAVESAPKNNAVTGNTLVRNRPNVFSDGTGRGNTIEGNTCTPGC
jgi:parallel beta-helix repeat protein